MFKKLNDINTKPLPFSTYTSLELWNDQYISQKMLELHLNKNVEMASRKKETIDNSISWIKRRFNLTASTRIFDFGCGPGLYTSGFAEAGCDVAGIDISERSIKYAMKKAKKGDLEIKYINQNYLTYAGKDNYDLVTMIYRDYSALSPEQRVSLLKIFYNNLGMDGCILLDIDSEKSFREAEEGIFYNYFPDGGFWSPEEHHEFIKIHKYGDIKVILRKYTIIEQNRTREIYVWIQCFSVETIADEFEKAGFDVTDVYSDITGKKYKDDSLEIAVCAKKG